MPHRSLSLFCILIAGCLKVPGAPEDFRENAPQVKTTEAVLCGLVSLDDDTFCMPGQRLERWMKEGDLHFLDGARTSTGMSGAMKMLVELTHPEAPEPLVFHVKWKPASAAWNGLNNSPRKEIAAYELQKLYLPQDQWLVPPTVMRCLPTEDGHTLAKRAGGDDFDCVWGMLSYWLSHLEAPGTIDWERFESDLAYRRAIANLNIYMFLIGHRDAHDKNWLLTTGPTPVRGISIDNGVSFSGIQNLRVTTNWNGLMVPSMPSDVVENLRILSDADLAKLILLGRWQVEDRKLERRASTGLEKRPGKGWLYRRSDGLYMHGLRSGELATVRRRIERLLRVVDSGRITTF